ncbi:hypothetical protein [Parahaliea aestuarii]|uniref:Lipoprotein n=1 Tax=Parahaliea aestuarii TaxID=1852021 RepID=A0A5C9A1G5_9GAMM|nr:hypothetical protein [Parahaliea aestuarii]TXS93467.1 hypothetical protein FVW59_06435 [Parahaliea aestuarii]
MTNFRSAKWLLIALGVYLLAGCKIVVLSHNVGGVASESTNRNCPAGELCEFDVLDIYFLDRFSGVASHPNYRFKEWQSGPRYLCGGMSEACALSTENFADNPALMSIIESDAAFYLVPRFERIGSKEQAVLQPFQDANPRVTDARGRFIGTIEPGEGLEPSNWTNWKGINIRLKGYAQHYLLQLEFDGSMMVKVANSKNNLGYTNATCSSVEAPSLILQTSGPAFGAVVGPDRPLPLVVGAGAQLYIPDPVESASRKAWTDTWDSAERECLAGKNGDGIVLPLVPLALEIDYPLSVEGTNIRIEGPISDSIVT